MQISYIRVASAYGWLLIIVIGIAANYAVLITNCDAVVNETEGASSSVTAGTEVVDVELGEVASDTAEGSFALSGTHDRLVTRIDRSCGCTVSSIVVGDCVTPGQLFAISIDLRRKPHGKGEQKMRLVFDDGSEAMVAVHYEYIPPPDVTPASVVFRRSSRSMEVDVESSGVGPLRITEIMCPNFLRYDVCVLNALHQRITFVIDDEKQCTAEEGVISIAGTCAREFLVRRSFIILKN